MILVRFSGVMNATFMLQDRAIQNASPFMKSGQTFSRNRILTTHPRSTQMLKKFG